MRVPSDVPLREWIVSLIDDGKLYRFYKTSDWLELRAAVLEDHHNECEMHKGRGDLPVNERYAKADTVHHEFEVKKHPDMALTRYLTEPDGTRREVLHPLCNDCHNIVHGRRLMGSPSKKKPVTEEWW
ncbi:hypothetical protein ACTQZK_06380 [Paraeggerthella sp. LCP19S3_G8]|uniref:hypothetical protein n=1 Tax=Paraeggerthella sp. LCP19S3_G8 TaxID=3440248 RepID=UPI002A8697E0|nr:hypothetical protein [Paraeggerthella sp.]